MEDKAKQKRILESLKGDNELIFYDELQDLKGKISEYSEAIQAILSEINSKEVYSYQNELNALQEGLQSLTESVINKDTIVNIPLDELKKDLGDKLMNLEKSVKSIKFPEAPSSMDIRNFPEIPKFPFDNLQVLINSLKDELVKNLHELKTEEKPDRTEEIIKYLEDYFDERFGDLVEAIKKISITVSSAGGGFPERSVADLQDIRANQTDGSQKTGLVYFKPADGTTNDVSTQNPLPTDGDSVYTKDVWVTESLTTNWTDADNTGEEIADIPFNNLHTHIRNATADNPKILRIHFNRTINASQVGLGCYESGNFSNVVVKLLGSGGEIRTTVDDSANNTKYTSRNYPFEPQLFNAVQLEFNTADEVCISNITIQKSVNVDAFIKAQRPDGIIANIQATNNGNIKNSLEELENNISVNNNTQLKTTLFDSSGNEVQPNTPLAVRQYALESDGSNYLSTHLKNGSAVDMSVDGSVTPVEFSYTVPAGKEAILKRGLVVIEDGVVAFTSGDFGAIAGALTNGLEASITPSGGSKQVIENWKTNRQLRDTMFDFDQEWKADGAYVGRWTFTRDINEKGFTLSAGDKFSFLVQDNLTDLDYLSFRIKGRISDV